MTWHRRFFYLCLEVGVTALIVLALRQYAQNNESFVVSTFGEIWDEFHRAFIEGGLGTDVVPTLRRIALGFALSVSIGFLLGLGLGSSRVVRLLSEPVLAFIRAIPPVALIPPAIILIGLGDNMKVMIVAFIGIWPVALNTADGVMEIDSTMRDTARAFHLSALERLFFVTIPAAAPRTFAGMQTTLAFCLIGVISTEFIAATEGLGFLINQAQQTFLIPQMWAGILMIGIIGYLLNALFQVVRRKTLFWETNRDASGPAG